MYKRVPRNKPALMQHLDDPIIEYIQLYRLDQEHFLSNLPMGKYIVCADYTVRGVIVQVSSHWLGPVNRILTPDWSRHDSTICGNLVPLVSGAPPDFRGNAPGIRGRLCLILRFKL